MDETNPYLQNDQYTGHNINEEDHGEQTDPLKLDIDEDELVKIVDKYHDDFVDYYTEKHDLFNRRKKNVIYLFGNQIAELEKANKVKDYEAKNLDNVLWEIAATTKPLAMSQMPDLIVTPGNQSQEAQDTAKLVSKAVDTDVKNRNNRQVLALAFKHRPAYFVGVIKAVWNPELAGGLGDYEFVNVHPDAVEFDYCATEPNADKMDWVSQLTKMTVQQALMRFPKSKKRLIEQLQRDGIVGKDSKPDWKAKATQIEVREVWFTYYEPVGKDDEYRRVEALLWKYKRVILDKMKNPDFDYEGDKQVFTYDNPQLASSKRPVTQDEMQQGLFSGVFPPNVREEQVYFNYFENPRKPFYFMTYDQWGKQPLDESSDLEQNIKNQEALDAVNKSVQEKLKNRGHHVWSKEADFKPSDIERMDHNNPNEDYLVAGNVNEVHEFIKGEEPTQQEFAEMDRLQNRMFALSGANAVRGQIQSDVATTNQIARESNYTRADDMVDETINPAAEWMAQWALQFIKLRYTQEHFRKILGAKGEVVFMKLHRNLVQDGMEVMIKASGTDKLKAQNNAQENARLQLTEPLSYFRDMGYEDAEDRTVMMITFMKDPVTYMQNFIEESAMATPDLIAMLQTLTVQAAPPAPVAPGQVPPQPGQANPQQPTPMNTQAVPAQPPTAPPPGSVRMM